jgi:hypothetical protein
MSCPSCYSPDTVSMSKNPYKTVSLVAGVCFIGASLTLRFSDMIWGIGIGLVVIAIGMESPAFGIFYFVAGYPLSLIVLKFSDNYAVSYFDKFKYPPFTIWKRKLLWSNGIASGIIWGGIFVLALIFKLYE